jgi:hypothetical protein
MKEQSQKHKARKRIGIFHRNPTATVTFECVSSSDAPDAPDASPELRIDNSGQPLLVFTRKFRLLMGRAHELPSQEKMVLPRSLRELAKRNNGEIPPCQKCACIWAPETEKPLLSA